MRSLIKIDVRSYWYASASCAVLPSLSFSRCPSLFLTLCLFLFLAAQRKIVSVQVGTKSSLIEALLCECHICKVFSNSRSWSWAQLRDSRPDWTLFTKAPSCAHAAAAAAAVSARVWQMPQNLSTAGHRQPEPEQAASSFINQQQTKREEEGVRGMGGAGGYIIYIEFNNNSWAAVDVALPAV